MTRPRHRKQLAKVRVELSSLIESYASEDGKKGYEAVAAKIGCTREALYNLTSLNSRKRPSLEMAAALQEVLGLEMKKWADKYEFKPRDNGEAA